MILTFCQTLWPFPTVSVQIGNSIDLGSLILKFMEICILVFYFLDLLPKILFWKKHILWKALNALLVALMVAQLPMSALQIYD
jgi:predicted heme/steroid binding protein